MPQTFVLPRQTALDDDASPMSGALAYFFETNSTTPQAVYADIALTTPHTHPLVADSAGRFPKAYYNPAAAANYRVRVTTADGVQVYQDDDIDRFTVSAVEIGQSIYPSTEAEDAVPLVPSSSLYKEGYLQRYGGIGNGTTVSTTALVNAAAQAAQTGGVAVKISGGTYRIDANTTIPTGLTLDFTEGGMLTIDSLVTLTLNCRIVASPGQQIFAGAGTVVFGVRSTPEVYPDWWGSAVGTINKACTATTGKFITVKLNNGKTYQFVSGLALANDGDGIVGPRRSNATSGGEYFGAVLEYTGASGTAIVCGLAPGGSAAFMESLELGGFTLKLTENTDIGLRLWHVSGLSHVHDITIRGSSDNDSSDNVGLQIDGCVDLDIERVLIFGQGLLGSGTSKLQNGVKISNGFSGSNTTTTRLRQVYISQCRIGAQVNDDSYVSFDHCVFESCYDAGLLLLNARVRLFDGWFEDNGASGNPPIRIQGAASSLVMDAGIVNVGSNQYFIGVEAAAQVTLLGGTRFASGHGSPRIFSLGGNQPAIAIVGECSYPASTTESDTTASKLVKVLDGTLTVRTLYIAEHTPASAGATGVADRVTRDDDYIYVCTATNTWKRTALTTW